MNSLDLMELQPGVSPALISKTVTNMLRLEMANDEMLPLLHSLIDGLTDEIVQSGKGSSLILCSLLETRAGEGKIVRDLKPQNTVWPEPILKKCLAGDKYHRSIKVHT